MRYGLHYDDDADEDGLSLQKAHTIYILFLVADLRRYIERKAYDPNEPRDDHGRWTAGGGSDAVSGTQVADNSNIGPLSTDDYGRSLSDLAKRPSYAYGSSYSSDRPGWHDYTAGPNIVCTAEQNCSSQEIADQLSRFAVPGQRADIPTISDSDNWVFLPGTSIPAGQVHTDISDDGLVVQNATLPDHILYDGVAIRSAYQNADGSWSVTTHGFGNNFFPFMDMANQYFGPSIFDALDNQMRDNINAHHGTQKSAARLIHIARSGRGIYPGQPIRTRPRTGGCGYDFV